MLELDLIAATAYQQGQRMGSFFIWALLAAIAFRIVRSQYAPGLGTRAGIIAGVALVLAHTVYYEVIRPGSFERAAPDRPAPTRVEQARLGMLDGCVKAGTPRAYCGCLTDEVFTRLDGDIARIDVLHAELSRMSEGSRPPAIIVQSIQACESVG